MAKITVYKGKPHLTLLSWFGMAMLLSSIAQILDKMVTAAYFCVLSGLFLLVFADRRAANRKMRIHCRTAAIWIFVYIAVSLIQRILDKGFAGAFTFSDWTILLVIAKNLIGILLAFLLMRPTVKNKPKAAALSCFGIAALNLFSCIQLLTAGVNNVYIYILVGAMLYPMIPGLILLLRGSRMGEIEKSIYVF